jgi:flagellar protein FliO/FliZ
VNFLAVGIVIALLFGAGWALRRSAPFRRSAKSVSVETAVSLGERRSLVIVSVEGKRLLLGLTPMQISLVAELGPGFPRTLEAKLDD